MSVSEVSNSKFVVGLLQNLDIAQNLTNAVNFQEDLKRADMVKKAIDSKIGSIDSLTKELNTLLKLDGKAFLASALQNYTNFVPTMIQYVHDAGAQSSAGYHLTASMMAQDAKFSVKCTI